jgi:hypothetical protein
MEDSKKLEEVRRVERIYIFLALLVASRLRTNVYEKFLLGARVDLT